MSRLWRVRWRELTARQVPVVERLLDIPRPGSPGRFTMEQITQLYALACEPPEKYNRPLSHWSARELALEMIQQGIVETISERHVGRLLQEASILNHTRMATGCIPPRRFFPIQSRRYLLCL